VTSSSLALCIPAYNESDRLPRLLESARGQTIPFDSILVYDDCSTDNTAEVARSYGAEVISEEVNQGCTIGRKRLAEHASVDWLHFHDADDVLKPNFVEQAQTWMQKDEPPDVVIFSYEERREDTDEKIDERHFDAEALREDPIEYTIRNVINPFCGLYRRKAFLEAGGPDTDPNVHYNEDAAMHCKLARAGLQFDADPTVTVVNYHREDSMSQANLVKCERARYHVLKKCARFNGDTHGEAIAHELWKIAGVLASRGEWGIADKSARLAVQLNGRVPSNGGGLFRALGMVHPQMALRVREGLIRLLKPHLRKQ
jgi:glycosyltransferase involved in cell wall biosynthesis